MDAPESLAAAVAAATQPIMPIGGSTKPGLVATTADVRKIELGGLRGIVSYDASEYLISALAGTPMAEIQAALAQRRQFLPFDPMFVAQGATLGGTVASGISGAGRMLYGGLRDFVMEVQLIDGLGKLVRGGGKVVKNAAGFDLPKLVVGSYGRLGIMTEVTLKVFPVPQASASLTATAPSLAVALPAIQNLLAQPLPIAALDLQPSVSGEVHLFARFSGPADSLPNVLARATAAWGLSSQQHSDPHEDQQCWQHRATEIERAVADASLAVFRIGTTLSGLPTLTPQLLQHAGLAVQHTGGGTATWLSVDVNFDMAALDLLLAEQKLSAVAVSGNSQGLQALGDKRWLEVARRIQRAIDPQQKFVSY